MTTSLSWSVGVVDAIEWACVLCGHTEWAEQWISIRFCVKLEHSSAETIRMIQKAAAMGNWWLAASSRQCTCSCITSRAEVFGDSAPLQRLLVPCDFWLFPKLKTLLKGKRFQTFDEIQENTMGQLMVTERTVWSPKVLTLKGTEVPLSYVRFLYFLQ